MKAFSCLSLVVLFILIGCTAAPERDHTAASPETTSPYAGQETRTIKALSNEDIEAYRSAQGMGLAMAAELNQYPGPKHALELADELNLTTEQRAQTQQVFDAMQTEAIPLGEQIIAKETELDALFAGGAADAAQVQALLREIGVLQADLRFVHLNAHITMKALLTETQVQHYDMVRGYTGGASHDHSNHKM